MTECDHVTCEKEDGVVRVSLSPGGTIRHYCVDHVDTAEYINVTVLGPPAGTEQTTLTDTA